jgi:hypothetical protein
MPKSYQTLACLVFVALLHGDPAETATLTPIQNDAVQIAFNAEVLTNISDGSVRTTVPIRLQELGLRPTAKYTVRLVSTSQTATLATDMAGDGSFAIDVPPLRVVVVTISQ